MTAGSMEEGIVAFLAIFAPVKWKIEQMHAYLAELGFTDGVASEFLLQAGPASAEPEGANVQTYVEIDGHDGRLGLHLNFGCWNGRWHLYGSVVFEDEERIVDHRAQTTSAAEALQPVPELFARMIASFLAKLRRIRGEAPFDLERERSIAIGSGLAVGWRPWPSD